MSDTSQGEGWWLASDGKWYPPESAPPPPINAYGTSPQVPLTTPQTALSPKEQARLDKAQRKALRPWYKKKRWYFLGAILLFVVLIIVIISSAANKVNQEATTKHTVVYSATGNNTSTATDITYYTIQQGSGQSGEAQDTNAALPWSKTITASGLFTAYSVSVTNAIDAPGLSGVTCTITVDGKVVNTNTANGPGATASCTS